MRTTQRIIGASTPSIARIEASASRMTAARFGHLGFLRRQERERARSAKTSRRTGSKWRRSERRRTVSVFERAPSRRWLIFPFVEVDVRVAGQLMEVDHVEGAAPGHLPTADRVVELATRALRIAPHPPDAIENADAEHHRGVLVATLERIFERGLLKRALLGEARQIAVRHERDEARVVTSHTEPGTCSRRIVIALSMCSMAAAYRRFMQ